MITEAKKNALAVAAGLFEERRIEIIREGVKEIYTLDDELAILRKEVAEQRAIIARLLGEELPPSEFTEYNNNVEAVKLNANPLNTERLN